MTIIKAGTVRPNLQGQYTIRGFHFKCDGEAISIQEIIEKFATCECLDDLKNDLESIDEKYATYLLRLIAILNASGPEIETRGTWFSDT